MGSTKLKAVGLASGDKWDLHGKTKIVQIIISYTHSSIKSLQFQYLENGELHTSDIIGCQDFSGLLFRTITFLDPDDYITIVEGSVNICGKIEDLRIHTNKGEVYAIFESEEEDETVETFRFDFGGENQFGGFHGTHSCDGVLSIGVHFKHLTELPAAHIKGTTVYDLLF